MNQKTSKLAFLLGSVALLVVSAAAADSPSAGYPDLSGSWNSTNASGLLGPQTGPGPIGDLEGYSHSGFGVDAAHRRNTSNPWIGNYRSSILTPWAADILKKEADTAIRGEDPFWAQSNCWPGGPAAVLWADEHYFVQTPRVVYIVYARDHDVRRVYLRASGASDRSARLGNPETPESPRTDQGVWTSAGNASGIGRTYGICSFTRGSNERTPRLRQTRLAVARISNLSAVAAELWSTKEPCPICDGSVWPADCSAPS